MKNEIRVIMVEDHPEYRASISLAIETQPDIVLSQQFGSAEQALRSFERNHLVDIVLLDLNLPGMSGLDAIPWFKKYSPQIKIIILSQSNKEADILQAIHLGANGYLLKESTLEQITQSIRTVIQDGATLDTSLAKFIFNTIQSKTAPPAEKKLLSERETQILSLLGQGLMKKEISEYLNIEITTVATHVRRIYEKLESPNAAAAVNEAYRKGIL